VVKSIVSPGQKVQTIYEAVTEDPPESALNDTLKELVGEIARNTDKLGGIEAALDRQTAALAKVTG